METTRAVVNERFHIVTAKYFLTIGDTCPLLALFYTLTKRGLRMAHLIGAAIKMGQSSSSA